MLISALHQESNNMVVPAMQLASKIPDMSVQLWSSALLRGKLGKGLVLKISGKEPFATNYCSVWGCMLTPALTEDTKWCLDLQNTERSARSFLLFFELLIFSPISILFGAALMYSGRFSLWAVRLLGGEVLQSSCVAVSGVGQQAGFPAVAGWQLAISRAAVVTGKGSSSRP